MSEQKQFLIGRAEHIIQQSNEVGSNSTSVVGIRQAGVTCACGHAWVANKSNGLRAVVGGVHISCPACGADERVHIRMFRAS